MSKRAYEGISGGIFLIGLGILFLTGSFWPWILLLVGLAGLPASLANKRGWMGWQGFFWLAGLAILFWSGRFWPGILILLGITALIGALTRESEGSPFASQSTETFSPPQATPPFSVDETPSQQQEE